MIRPEEQSFLIASDIDPVKKFLQNALNLKCKGDPYQYNHLVKQLIVRDDPEMLWRVYIGLSSSVKQLTQIPEKFRDLIQAIFNFDWRQEQKIIISYMHLLSQIVSCNTTFLVASFQNIINNMIPESSKQALADEEQAKLFEIQSYLHRTLESLILLVPSGKSDLYPVIYDNFPHKRFSSIILSQYIMQLLKICEYIPILQPKIINLIFQKCLELDVEIVIEDTGDVVLENCEEGNYDPNEEMFYLEGNTPIKASETSDLHHNSMEAKSQKIRDEVIEMADKLDAILLLLISFIDASFDNSHSTQESQLKLFLLFLQIFEEQILTTHKSKFIQFVLFYICSKSSQFAIIFCRRLIQLFLDSNIAGIYRQSAVLYFASFAARANFLPLSLVSESLFELLAWADEYVTSSGSRRLRSTDIAVASETITSDSSIGMGMGMGAALLSSSSLRCSETTSSTKSNAIELEASDLTEEIECDEFGRRISKPAINSRYLMIERHETFFCCVQALCYVSCFRGTPIAKIFTRNKAWKCLWENVVSSALNPLRHCIETVRVEFLRLAQFSDLFSDECWDLLPPELLQISLDFRHHVPTRIGGGQGKNPLDSFFPYDPCLLHSLNSKIEDGYISWTGVPGVDVELSGGMKDWEVVEGGRPAWDVSGDCSGLRHREGEGEGDQETEATEESLASSTSYGTGSYGQAMSITDSMGGGGGGGYYQDTSGVSVTAGSLMSSGGSDFGSWEDHSRVLTLRDRERIMLEKSGGVAVGVGVRRARQFSISSVGSW